MRSTTFLFSLLLLVLTTLTTIAVARQEPTSYCKCICFQNSTIIPLNPPPSTSQSPRSHHRRDLSKVPIARAEDPDAAKHHKLTCNDCNRAFCLDYNLPICKNAREEDVFAQCFQRDSLKDEMVVIVFILLTTSLLGWALIKPYVMKAQESSLVQTAGRYMPMHSRTLQADLPLSNAGRPNQPGASGRGRTREAGASISRQGGLNS